MRSEHSACATAEPSGHAPLFLALAAPPQGTDARRVGVPLRALQPAAHGPPAPSLSRPARASAQARVGAWGASAAGAGGLEPAAAAAGSARGAAASTQYGRSSRARECPKRVQGKEKSLIAVAVAEGVARPARHLPARRRRARANHVVGLRAVGLRRLVAPAAEPMGYHILEFVGFRFRQAAAPFGRREKYAECAEVAREREEAERCRRTIRDQAGAGRRFGSVRAAMLEEGAEGRRGRGSSGHTSTCPPARSRCPAPPTRRRRPGPRPRSTPRSCGRACRRPRSACRGRRRPRQ